jgi:LysR family hydrogen peroxide-inducible transcriptional activator
VTLLPALAVPTEIRRAPLVVRPLADPEAFRMIGLVWRPTSPLAPALRRLVETMRAAYPIPDEKAPGVKRGRPSPKPAGRGILRP